MNLRADGFSSELLLIGDLLAGGVLLWRARKVAWLTLSQAQLTGWLGASTLLAVLWQLQTGIQPGLNFHLLGASALTLICGRDKALVGMAAVVLANCAAGQADWLAAGWNWLLGPCVGIVMADRILQLSQTRLPPNYFAYFFTNGFFGAAVSFIAAALCLLGFHALAGSYAPSYLLDEALPYYLLFSWSEAFTSGLIIAVLVIYRPQWVESFDDRRYLSK
ncbi:energy-coupling factor ABC transporter permease [Chitinimonas sp. PSY-7]|uniref:energy-coupling factor ABC transporter permease n=1 Tax=Chitinimonas sp. PSY-7 TaxID=3459088 RepID=UPI00403FD189